MCELTSRSKPFRTPMKAPLPLPLPLPLSLLPCGRCDARCAAVPDSRRASSSSSALRKPRRMTTATKRNLSQDHPWNSSCRGGAFVNLQPSRSHAAFSSGRSSSARRSVVAAAWLAAMCRASAPSRRPVGLSLGGVYKIILCVHTGEEVLHSRRPSHLAIYLISSTKSGCAIEIERPGIGTFLATDYYVLVVSITSNFVILTCVYIMKP